MNTKKIVINKLKKILKQCDMTYLCTDGDREGEAISFNIHECLNLKNNYKRIIFYEITETGLLNGMNE